MIYQLIPIFILPYRGPKKLFNGNKPLSNNSAHDLKSGTAI